MTARPYFSALEVGGLRRELRSHACSIHPKARGAIFSARQANGRIPARPNACRWVCCGRTNPLPTAFCLPTAHWIDAQAEGRAHEGWGKKSQVRWTVPQQGTQVFFGLGGRGGRTPISQTHRDRALFAAFVARNGGFQARSCASKTFASQLYARSLAGSPLRRVVRIAPHLD